MASSSFLSSPILPLKSLSRTQTTKPNQNTRICTQRYVMRRHVYNYDHNQNYDQYNHSYSGRLVDENLIVLRKRIHETKMMEGKYEPPSDWMDWEKQFYLSYDSIICDAMASLQSYLMETRPSMALAMIALIILSVPISTAIVMFNLLELTKRSFLLGFI